MRHRLFNRLALAFLAAGVLVVLLAGFFIERQLRDGLTAWIETDLAAKAALIARMAPAEIARQTGDLARHAGARLTLIDAAGRVTADSQIGEVDEGIENHLHRPEVQEARLRGRGTTLRYSQTRKLTFLYVAVPLPEGGYVRLARPLEEAKGAIDEIRLPLFGDLLLVVFGLLALVLFLTWRSVRPLGRLTAFTERVHRGERPGRIRIETRDEIGRLGENVNGIIERLQEQIRAAEEERRKLESVFAGMAEGLVVLDAGQRIESLNPGMAPILGERYGEAAGQTLLEAFRNVPLQDAFERHRATGETVQLETNLGGEPPRLLEVTINAVPGDDGAMSKTLLVFHDVTRLKRLERIRTDFVANVTHEIRTPLTAIIGFVETLLRGAADEPETARRFLETILGNARRLDRLVEDLLTLSALELGETALRLEALAPSEAVEAALAVVEGRAAEKGIRILRELPGDLPPLRADRDRLAQILLNLLDNAVKFTPAGGTVTVGAAAAGAGLLLRIADTGPGVPKEEIPRLGERFYRADRARARELGGTGLGLSIVKHLMKAHGGSLAIESVLGRGTVVTLRFPAGEEAP